MLCSSLHYSLAPLTQNIVAVVTPLSIEQLETMTDLINMMKSQTEEHLSKVKSLVLSRLRNYVAAVFSFIFVVRDAAVEKVEKDGMIDITNVTLSLEKKAMQLVQLSLMNMEELMGMGLEMSMMLRQRDDSLVKEIFKRVYNNSFNEKTYNSNIYLFFYF